MEKTLRQGLRMNGAEPCVEQRTVNGYNISWNPDDERFYVYKGEDCVTHYKDMRNAVSYCKNH
jgi:hypothetical protein